MIGRRQLAVASPVSPAALARAYVDSRGASDVVMARARAAIDAAFAPSAMALTDSGTSALVLALRATVPRGGTVGLPGYSCVDLTAAALYAGVGVRVYDVDPATLSPDIDSVARMLDRGVDAVVVAHLFGYPADVGAVRELAASRGVTVIEDAAQGAGGGLRGVRLGCLGELSVLSFGRGKGLCAGGGGALLAFGDRAANLVRSIDLGAPARGARRLATTAVQWALGRPSVYALPASVPWLHLGEMVYHPADEPTALPSACAALLPWALSQSRDVEERQARAREIDAAVDEAEGLARVVPIGGSEPGFLRYAVRDASRLRLANPRLGIVRPYPTTVVEQPQIQPILRANEPEIPGASEVRDTLLTMPTHHMVDARDLARLRDWMSAPIGE